MSTKLSLKEIDKEISKEQIEKAKKELNKRLQNNDKEVKK
jgi:hypothetical protein